VTSATGVRPDPRRVVEVHHQARRSLAVTLAFVLAAPLAAALPHSTGAWLPLHLFLVGGLLSAISGATQLLAVTWAAAPAPNRNLAALQRALVVFGAVSVAGGRELELDALTAAGGLAVVGALALLARILVGVRAGATNDRFDAAVDAYLVAIALGLAGTPLGVALALGADVDGLRPAHLTLNVLGLVTGVILATLPHFVATQARTKLSPSFSAGRLRAQTITLAAATLLTALGHLVDRPGAAAIGLVIAAGAIAATPSVLPQLGARQRSWAGPRLWQLLSGVAWVVAMTLALAVAVLGDRGDGAVLRALAVGGFAQILVGSLAYFGPVLRGGGHEQLTDGFRATRSWVSLVAGNVAGAAALAGADAVLVAVLAVWAIDVAARAALLVRGGR
jgi:hypothetical protein